MPAPADEKSTAEDVPEESSGPKLAKKQNLFKKVFTQRVFSAIFIILVLSLVGAVLFNNWAGNQIEIIDQGVGNTGSPFEDVIEDVELTADWSSHVEVDHNYDILYPDGWSVLVENQSNDVHVATFTKDTVEGEVLLYTVELLIYPEQIGAAAYAQEGDDLGPTNRFSFQGDKTVHIKLVRKIASQIPEDTVTIYEDIFAAMVESLNFNGVPLDKECKPTGCSSQICSDTEITTTCEFLEVYSCYQTATCKRQNDGECGWTMTPELKSCVQEKS